MHELEIVTDQRDGCGEGPLWDPSANRLYWVDITGEKLHTCCWPSKHVTTTKPELPISAVALTESPDRVVVAGASGVWLWDQKRVKTPVLCELNGGPLPVNDCIADARGRLLAGSTFYDGTESFALGALYSIDTDGTVSILDTGFGLSNGLGFSPDNAILYFTDSVARRIYSYDYDLDTGSTTRRRTFVQVSGEEGLPDGLTVDAEGFVWSAQWFGSCVVRYDPTGAVERRIHIPADQTSSVAFGGPHLTDVFVTSAALPDALALAPPAYRPSENVGGQLFHFKVGIQGKPEFRCRVSCPDLLVHREKVDGVPGRVDGPI